MWFASAKPPYGTLDAAEWAPSTASKADICSAKLNVCFTPESGHSAYRFDEFPDRRFRAGAMPIVSVRFALWCASASAVHSADFPASHRGGATRLTGPL